MNIAIPREMTHDETRVAAVPQTVKTFVAAGLEVLVERGAGERACFHDADYKNAGAKLIDDVRELLSAADLLVKITKPTQDEIAHLRRGAVVVAPLDPAGDPELLRRLAEAGLTAFALDAVPRIARAQSMDILSSMASLAGYKAVLIGAAELPKLMPMMMTAAGTIQAASVLVIGAGVAGLQAIATSRRLGANVKAVDVRPAVAEQVESLGAKFVPMQVEHGKAETAGGYARDLGEEFYKQEQDIISPHLAGVDMVITTALIPGRAAPKLITEAMVETMPGGAVIVDVAAPAGGNCSLSRLNERVVHRGVTIFGPGNLPATMPVHASLMFARNVAAFLKELIVEGQLRINLDNEVIGQTLVVRDGQIQERKA